MVNPHEDRNSVLHQSRAEEPRERAGGHAGRLPYPGEIVGRKEPPYQATGLDALSPLLHHVDFPCTLDDVIAAIGHARIPIDKMRTAQVSDLLQRIGPQEFRSSRELEVAFSNVFREKGIRETRGGNRWQSDNTDGRPVN